VVIGVVAEHDDRSDPDGYPSGYTRHVSVSREMALKNGSVHAVLDQNCVVYRARTAPAGGSASTAASATALSITESDGAIDAE
jgi:hypothetical protein